MMAGVVCAIVVGAAVRVAGIGTLSLWFDEGYTAWVINHPAAQMLHLIRADTSPPLFYLLLHGWTVLFGRSEAALRSLSAVCGIATIALVAGIAGRVFTNSPAAVVAATWLFALNWFAVDYCQEARSYEMSVILVAAMLYCLLSHLARPRWFWLAGFIAAAAIGLYVNNFMPMYVATVGISGLVLPSEMKAGRRARDGFIVVISLAAIYLPWIGSLYSQVQRVQQDFWISRPTIDLVCQELSRICGVEHFWTWDQYVHRLFSDVAVDVPRAAAALLIAGIVIGLFTLRGNDRRVLVGLIIAGLLPVLAAVGVSLGRRSIFLPAAFVPSAVVMSVLLAGPLAWCRERFAGPIVALVVLLCAANLFAYEHERTKEDWRSAASIVAHMPSIGHRVIVFVANEAQLPFDYYYHPRPGDTETGLPQGFFDVDPPRTQLRVLSVDDLASLRKRAVGDAFDDLVLVDSHAGWVDDGGIIRPGYSDPYALTARYLLGSMQVVSRTDLPDQSDRHQITIWRFVPR
jgi:mannosyltransferase